MRINNKLKKYLFLFVFFLLLFLKSSFLFDHVESGIYLAYTESFVEDGDLNTVNQQVAQGDVSPVEYSTYKNNEKGIVSPRLNSPTFWSHGGVILWTPFYYVGAKLNTLFSVEKLNEYKFIHLMMVLSNIFYLILGLIIISKVLKSILKNRDNSYKEIAICFFSTPVFFYSIIEPGNANLLGIFLAAMIILLSFKAFDQKVSNVELISLGVLCGISWVIKIDLIFHLIISGAVIIKWVRKKEYKQVLRYLYVIFGFLLVSMLQMVNDYIKYDFFSYGYIGTSHQEYSVLFDALLSPYRGHLYYSPIYILAFFASLESFWDYWRERKSKNLLLGLIVFIPIIKEYFSSQTFVHGSGNFGARMYCVELCLVVLLISYWLRTKRLIKIKWCLLGLSFIWTQLMFYFYYRPEMFDYPLVSYHVTTKDYLYGIIDSWENIIDFFVIQLSTFPMLKTKIIYFTPIVALLTWPLFKILNMTDEEFINSKRLRYSSIILLFLYVGVTASNLYFNEKNSNQMKERGFFKNMLIGKGTELYLYEENIASIEERMIQIKSSNRQQYDDLIRIRNDYHLKSVGQLISFPKNDESLRNYFPFYDSYPDPLITQEIGKVEFSKYDSSIFKFKQTSQEK